MLQIETTKQTETNKQDSEPSITQTPTPKRKIIKITGSINPMLWYSKCIGQEFEVLRFEMSKRMGLTAWVLEPHPYLRFINWVACSDYEVVGDEVEDTSSDKEVGGTGGKEG